MWWWHRYILDHAQVRVKVTIGLGDTSKGILIKCACGKDWAS